MKQIKASWTVEIEDDLKSMHNIDFEQEMVNILSQEISNEIDNQIIFDIVFIPKTDEMYSIVNSSDIGHAHFFGPRRSGKTTAMKHLTHQFLKQKEYGSVLLLMQNQRMIDSFLSSFSSSYTTNRSSAMIQSNHVKVFCKTFESMARSTIRGHHFDIIVIDDAEIMTDRQLNELYIPLQVLNCKLVTIGGNSHHPFSPDFVGEI
jgi:hypothetical protein